MNTKKSPGWGWAVFWLVFLWPLGLFLVLRKYNHKTVIMSASKAPMVAAWILISLGVITLLSNTQRLSTDYFVTLALVSWVVGGVLILIKTKKIKVKAEQYQKYLNRILNCGERNLDNLASAASVTYGQAQTDIQAMIDGGYLQGAIQEANRTIVLVQDMQAAPPPYTVAPAAPSQPDLRQQSRSVRCPGCGANNVVSGGRITECEYCGTPLNG